MEQGLGNEEYLVLEFLEAFSTYAFTAEGIQSQLPGFVRGELVLLDPGGTLDGLVQRGAVDREAIDGLVFFAVHRDRTSRGDLRQRRGHPESK